MEWKNFDQLASYKELEALAGSVDVKTARTGENGAERVAKYQGPMSGGLTFSYAAKAVDAFEYMSRTEGISPAIESSHAIAHAIKIAKNYSKDQSIIINVSGRGDKDVAAIARYRGVDLHE